MLVEIDKATGSFESPRPYLLVISTSGQHEEALKIKQAVAVATPIDRVYHVVQGWVFGQSSATKCLAVARNFGACAKDLSPSGVMLEVTVQVDVLDALENTVAVGVVEWFGRIPTTVAVGVDEGFTSVPFAVEVLVGEWFAFVP